MPSFDEPNDPGTDGAGIRQVYRLPISDEMNVPITASTVIGPVRALEAQSPEMPNARPSSEFSLIQEEAKNRLHQVYNGPVFEAVSCDIADASLRASHVIDTSTADGPVDLELNESNVRGLMTFALTEAGLNRKDCQTLIKKMEEIGIGSPVTDRPAGSIGSGAGQFEESPGHSMRSDGGAPSRGYEPRERSNRAR